MQVYHCFANGSPAHDADDWQPVRGHTEARAAKAYALWLLHLGELYDDEVVRIVVRDGGEYRFKVRVRRWVTAVGSR